MKLFDSKRAAPLLFFYILSVCLIPNVALAFTEHYPVAGALANVVLPAGVYMLLMTLSRRIGLTGCWMFIVMFFAAFQIVLLDLFGRSVIAVDMFLNLVTTNPTEVGELLGNMLPVILLVIVLYLPPLALSVICVVRRVLLPELFRRRCRMAGLVSSAIGLLLVSLAYILPGRYSVTDNLYPINVGYNIWLAVNRTVKTSRYHETSARFSYAASSTRPADEREIYVAVLGETNRAPQWHIFGYPRNTTSPLDSLARLVAFPSVLSESNTTHKSVPMLMSSLEASTFEDSVYVHKGLIEAFNEAGFRTFYFSNQARNHSFIDFFGEEADSVLFINELPGTVGHRYDHELLSFAKNAIESSAAPKLLIVLHCYGSHFSYLDRYPAGSGLFLPDSPLEVTGSNNERLINAYDNSIHYTSAMLADLAAMLASYGCRSAFIYTSDHGEDIYDDSRGLFLHASPVPSYYQLHVPLLLWMSDTYARSCPELVANAVANTPRRVSSSRSYFHTLLHMAGINSPFLKPEASLVSGSYKPTPPMYLDDHNEGVSLFDCGLMEQDFDCLRRAVSL